MERGTVKGAISWLISGDMLEVFLVWSVVGSFANLKQKKQVICDLLFFGASSRIRTNRPKLEVSIEVYKG